MRDPLIGDTMICKTSNFSIILWAIKLLFMKILNFLEMFLKNRLWANIIILWAITLLFMKMLNFLEIFLKNRLQVDRIILWAITPLSMKMLNFLEIFLKNRLQVDRIMLWAISAYREKYHLVLRGYQMIFLGDGMNHWKIRGRRKILGTKWRGRISYQSNFYVSLKSIST